MKSKPVRKPEVEQEDDDEVEVAASGPGIASAKKSKMAIILFSSIFATLVIYFFFFKDQPKTVETLDAVEAPQVAAPTTGSDRSPFEIDVTKDESQQEGAADNLDEPQEPAVPALPDLPKGDFDDKSSAAPEASAATTTSDVVADDVNPALMAMAQNDLQNQILQMQQQIDIMQQQMSNAFEANKTPPEQKIEFQQKIVDLEKRVSSLSGQGIAAPEKQQQLQLQIEKLQQNVTDLAKKDDIPAQQKQQIIQQTDQFQQKISDSLDQTKLTFDDKSLIKKEAEKIGGKAREIKTQTQIPELQYQIKQFDQKVEEISSGKDVSTSQRKLLKADVSGFQDQVLEVSVSDKSLPEQKQKIISNFEDFQNAVGNDINQTKLSLDDKNLLKKEVEKIGGKVRSISSSAQIPDLQYQIKQFDQKIEEVVQKNDLPQMQKKSLQQPSIKLQEAIKLTSKDKIPTQQQKQLLVETNQFEQKISNALDQTKLTLDEKSLVKKEVEKISGKAREVSTQAQIPDLQYQIKQFDQKIEEVVQKNDLPQMQKKSLQQPSIKLQEAIKLTSKDNKILPKQKDELRQRSDAFEKKVNEILNSNKLSAGEKRPLKQEVKTLQEQVRSVSNPSELIELRQQIKNVEEKVAALSEVKKVPPNQRRILQKQAEDLDKKADEIVASTVGANALSKEQQQKLEQQIQDLSKQVTGLSSQSQIPQLQQQIKKLDTQISSLSKTNQLPPDQGSQLQGQIQELSKQVASLSKQDQVPLLREDIKRLQSQVDLFAKSGNPATLQPVIIQQGGEGQAAPTQIAPTASMPALGIEQPKKELNPRYAPIVVFSGGAGNAPALGLGYDKNIVQLKEDEISKLQKTQPGVTATYIADRAHTIAQGKILTAVLETAIDTQVPGSVRAVVSRDVYAEAGSEVLIPRGSRLFGAYSSQITRGQGRVQIGWKRLIRPDGVDLAISFIAADQFGRSGIYGDIDNKYDVVIANSLLSSLLTVGGVAAAQALIGNNATTTTTNPSQGSVTTTGNASNQALYDVSKTIIGTANQIISNSLNSNPVIRVPQGTRIAVIVNSDIVIPSMRRK